MSHRRNLTELNLLQKSQQKSELEIEDYKQQLISEIKQWNKEDIPARANILFQLNDNEYSKVCQMVNFKQEDNELKVDVGTTSFIFIREGKL